MNPTYHVRDGRAATLVTALALESAGFFAAYALLHPDDDAGVVSSVVGTLALAATDVAWLLVAPVIAHVLWTAALTLLWPLRGCGPEPLETPADTPRTTSRR